MPTQYSDTLHPAFCVLTVWKYAYSTRFHITELFFSTAPCPWPWRQGRPSHASTHSVNLSYSYNTRVTQKKKKKKTHGGLPYCQPTSQRRKDKQRRGWVTAKTHTNVETHVHHTGVGKEVWLCAANIHYIYRYITKNTWTYNKKKKKYNKMYKNPNHERASRSKRNLLNPGVLSVNCGLSTNQ